MITNHPISFKASNADHRLSFYIHTYGCQMNERDSEIAAGLLLRAGYAPASDEQSADIIIVNTCSVRLKAEDKAIGKLRLLLVDKARNRPALIVGMIGCMVQREGEGLLKKLPKLDFALTPQHISRLPAAVKSASDQPAPILELDARAAPPLELLSQPVLGGPRPFSETATYINILYGCDRRCAYCIVPSVRGPEYSRPVAEIVAEAKASLKLGVKEITLLGQSVMRYGRQPGFQLPAYGSETRFTEPLPRLMEELSSLPGLSRLRFTSGHPGGCSAELARAMAILPPVCEHIHLPVQSGSDRILRLMRRGYTADDYRRAVARLRSAMPTIAITTDVIVGFPSETNEEFDETVAFMREIGFDNAFIFKYSPRPGTPAANMPDDVPDPEKLRRNHVLLKMQNQQALTLNQALVGTTQEVLVRGPSRRNPKRWTGRTRSNKIVVFTPASNCAPGDLLNVQIKRVTAQTLYA